MPQEEREFIRRLARQRARHGQRIPDRAELHDVDLDPRFTDLWDAFLDLKSSAGCGMAPEPIAPADVRAWCEMHEVPTWRQRTFWRVVQHLDKEHRRVTTKRRESERDKPEG